jgi:hypothetical protein
MIHPPGGATEELLAQAEKLHKIVLPAAYREFLLRYNGGQPQPGWVRCAKVQKAYAPRLFEEVTSFDGIQRFLDDKDRSNLVDELGMPKACFRIAESHDNGIVLMRLTRGKPEQIYYWDLVDGDYADAKESGRVIKIGTSFADFIQSFDYPPDAQPWLEFIHKDDAAGCRRWLDEGGDPNVRSEYCNSPLEEAAFHGRLEITKMLMNRQAQPGSGFLYAVQAGHRDVARFLAPFGVKQDDALEAVNHYEWVNDDAALLQTLNLKPRPKRPADDREATKPHAPAPAPEPAGSASPKEVESPASRRQLVVGKFVTSIQSMALSPDDRWLLANDAPIPGGKNKNPIRVWDLHDLNQAPRSLAATDPTELKFAPDGGHLYYLTVGV